MSGDLTFREVIRPPFWLLAFVAFMLASIVIAVWAAFTNDIAIATAVGCAILLLLFFRTNIHRIEINNGELFVDKAHLELVFIDSVDVLSQENFIEARTRGLDPAAYPALIYWISRGVKVYLKDPRDSTPYWLISTKKGEELSALLANSL